MFRALLITALACLGALPDASAQVPVSLEQRSADAYVVEPYNFTRFGIPLTAGYHAIGASNDGPGSSEIWVRHGSDVLWHETVGAHGFGGFRAPDNDTYRIDANGNGRLVVLGIALVNQVLASGMGRLTATVTDRYGEAVQILGRHGDLCIDSSATVRADVYDRYLEPEEHLIVDHLRHYPVEDGEAHYLIFRPTNTSEVRLGLTLAAAGPADCGPERQGTVTPAPSSSRGLPGSTALSVLISIAAAATMWTPRRKRRREPR